MSSLVHLHPRMVSNLLNGRPVLGVVQQTLANQVLELRAEVEVVVDLDLHDVPLQVWVVLGFLRRKLPPKGYSFVASL